MLTINRARTTNDVDTVVDGAEHGDVMRAAKQVANEIGLPSWWLNDSVSVYTSTVSHLRSSEVNWYGHFPKWDRSCGLEVRVASASYLLAMKTVSRRLRPSDLEDIERLAEATGFTSTEAIMINLRRYFPTGQATGAMAAAVRDIVSRINP